MKYTYIIMLIILIGCGGGGGDGSVIDNTPRDPNAIHILVFNQPPVYDDNTLMDNTPDREITGYEIFAGQNTTSLVPVAYINNPLEWTPSLNQWVGTWNIWDNHNVDYIRDSRPNGSLVFSLRAISVKVDDKGVQFKSALSVPWVYTDPPYALDNTTPKEGDIYAQDPSSPVNMLFNTGSGNK